MKRACLYVRVSTDEQADKGYSQRDQEERLTRYCLQNNIAVENIVYEDHSAKTFIRPEWIRLLNLLKKVKSCKVNLVIFTKWDRFSRNAGDAYQMINTLRKLGIEPHAIEQPLDLLVPENKMMLAIYLAAPEVENDRRALNTFNGMRRARKEGRMMGTAPFGYINRSREDGRKYIAVQEPQASAMRWAFNEIAKGVYAVNQIRLKMNENYRTHMKKSAFYGAIRNPLYYGFVYISKYQDEEAYFVKGQHEPLITKELFDKVQKVIHGYKKDIGLNVKVLSDSNLPLRGFLGCSECGRLLTGSASTGRSRRYYYYHCVSSCGFRYRADIANGIFENVIQNFKLNKTAATVVKKLLLENYKRYVQNPYDQKASLIKEIEHLNSKLSMARNKLLSEVIDDNEYLDLKKEYKKQIESLEDELGKIGDNIKKINIDRSLENALENLENIGSLYIKGSIDTKRSIIGSIFPEKLEFNGINYRTARMNNIASCIMLINKQLCKKENRKNDNYIHFSGLVLPTGLEPVTKRL